MSYDKVHLFIFCVYTFKVDVMLFIIIIINTIICLYFVFLPLKHMLRYLLLLSLISLFVVGINFG